MRTTLAWIALFAFGCAHNVFTPYPRASPGETGTVIVRLTEPLEGVVVTVNGAIVAEGERTDRVEVAGVPAGRAVVRVTSSAWPRAAIDASEVVEVLPDDEVTVSLASPGYTTGALVVWGALFAFLFCPPVLIVRQ